MKRFLEILKEEEGKALESKTGWGKNELKLLLAEAKLQAMIRYQEEKKIGAEVSP